MSRNTTRKTVQLRQQSLRHTSVHTCILLLFNRVTRRFALCIKYNQYAQPQKGVTKGATKYMSYKSASRVRTKVKRSREVTHIQCSEGIFTDDDQSISFRKESVQELRGFCCSGGWISTWSGTNTDNTE